jgi:hypothetical protein
MVNEHMHGFCDTPKLDIGGVAICVEAKIRQIVRDMRWAAFLCGLWRRQLP